MYYEFDESRRIHQPYTDAMDRRKFDMISSFYSLLTANCV